MTLTIDLAPDMEARLRDRAAEKGLEPDRYVLQRLAADLGAAPEEAAPAQTEAELLQRINEGQPPEVWRQYRSLLTKRDAGTLTAEERQTLLGLIDRIEFSHARRMKYLVQLSDLRGTTLDELMDTLGIPKPSDDLEEGYRRQAADEEREAVGAGEGAHHRWGIADEPQ